MNQVSNISGVYRILPLQQRNTAVAEAPDRSGQRFPRDEVEISEVGALLARANNASVRAEKIARIRAQIAAQTFETPERFDGTVERLIAELQSHADS